jgi:hypothetical protein
MIKKYTLFIFLFIGTVLSGYGQADENFSNIPTNSSGSYLTRSWTGTDDVTWTAIRARTDQTINGKAICTSGTGSVTSPTYTGGMGTLTFNYVRAFTGTGARNIEVWVNGTKIGSTISVSTTSNTVVNYSNAINITGDVVLELRTSGNQIKIDDISWTAAASSDLEITGTPTDHGETCLNTAATTVQYTITNNSFGIVSGVTVASDNTEFVADNLSTLTILPSATATFDVTFTPTNLNGRAAEITVSSATTSDATIDVTGTGVTVPTITAHPTNQSVTEPATATFNVTATNATSYQWQVSTGGAFTNVSSGGTTNTYTITTTSSTMNGYQYQCVVTNTCGNTTSTPATLTVLEIANVDLDSTNPATTASSILQAENDHVIYQFDLTTTLNDTELTGVTFTTTGTYAASNITNFKLYYDDVSTFNSSTAVELDDITTSLGTGTHTFTSFSEDLDMDSTTYLFITADTTCDAPSGNTIAVNAITTANLTFTSATKSGSAYSSGTHTFATANPNNVTGQALTNCQNGATSLDWTDPTDCWENVLVFATDGSFTSATPSGNGTAYAANSTFGVGTAFDGGFCVFNGTGNSESISSLTNDTTYTFKIFTRNNLTWSSGVTVSCTPVLEYCNAGPTASIDSEIENVVLVGENNTISNNTTNVCTGGEISDFTAMSADLSVGGSYNLSVEFGDCNDGTQYNGAGGVWVDWNSDGDFNDANETIGTVDLAVSGGNVTEIFTVSVPNGTTLGNYRMRIVQEEGESAGDMSPCGTFSWGAVEDYTIEVIVACTPVHTITNFSPTSGPENTLVTIFGTGFTGSTAVNFNNISATIVSQSTTKLVVSVPAGETTGAITLLETGCSISSALDFTVITTENCAASSSFTDVFISEVYDSNGGNVWHMELYNPTGTAVDLNALGTDYTIERYGTIGDPSPSRTIDLTGIIPPNSTFTISLGDSADTCSLSYDLTISGAGINEVDEMKLVKSGVEVDVVEAPNEKGYTIKRLNTAVGPTTTYSSSDWTRSSSESCTDLGLFNLTLTSPPSISGNPQPINDCTTGISFNIAAAAGNSGALTYQWLYNDGVANGWSAVLSTSFAPGTVTGETTDTIAISGFNLEGYQFYCEVKEDGACETASNAAIVNIAMSTWTIAGGWDNGTPDLNTIVVLNDDYNTGAAYQNAGIVACSLTVNPGFTLTVNEGFTVEVENNVTNNGVIVVLTDGSFVQHNDDATFINSVNDNSSVTKKTAPLNSWAEYTYWSSPVVGEKIEDALNQTNANRRFWFNAANYRDSGYETNNNNVLVYNGSSAGIDNIDDNGNDWHYAIGTDAFTPGLGYAATLSNTAYNDNTPASLQFPHTFSGPFNNGVITVPVFRNDEELGDTNNNLIGNPYASAIDFDLFMAENSIDVNASGALEYVAYLWSHDTSYSSTTNGNSAYNFGSSDYAIINDMTQVAGGDNNNDGIIDAADEPSRYIPSGQGFFVNYMNSGIVTATSNNAEESGDEIAEGTVTFRNAMRVSGNNNRFFKGASNMPNEDNILWLLLASDNGVGSQIAVGYKDGPTDGYDGNRYDARRNASPGATACFYSIVENNTYKFAIQGKAKESLNLDEVIPLGVYTNIEVPTIYTISVSHFQGEFFNSNTIYLKDYLLEKTHDLSSSDYSFTSQVGDFKERFEIVFKTDALGTDSNEVYTNNLSIIELQNNDVKFVYSGDLTINAVKIIDVLGRVLYNFKGRESTEIFNLTHLSSAAYFAQVELSNGKVITKKAIKK